MSYMLALKRMRGPEWHPGGSLAEGHPAPRPRETHIVNPSPTQLTQLVGYGGRTISLLNPAGTAYQAMLAAARRDGIPAPLLEVVSGFRPLALQQRLWDEAAGKYPDEHVRSLYVARPGHSVHQTGRAVDLWLGYSIDARNSGRQRQTPAYKWLVDHALSFDFVPYLREPWHWEYTPLKTEPPRNEKPGSTPASPANGIPFVVYPNEVRVGGSVAWRNNNPGNIVAGSFTRAHGAIPQVGTSSAQGRRFAVFPDEATGMRAIVALLKTPKYRNLSLRDAFKRYAPATDHNDPVAYARFVHERTGLDPDVPLSHLSDEQLGAVARAIRVVEGWRPGTIYNCATPSPAWVHPLLHCSASPPLPSAPTAPAPSASIAPSAGTAPVILAHEDQPPLQTLYMNIPLGGYPDRNPTRRINPMTGIFLPPAFQPTPQVDVLLYLQGHHDAAPNQSIQTYWHSPKWALREPHGAGHRNIVLIAPSLGPRSESGWLSEPGGLGRYIDLVLGTMASYTAYVTNDVRPQLGRMILACHSGGGWPMRKIATSGGRYADHILECWGFDCLYNNGDEPAWARWAAARPSNALYVHYLGSTATRSQNLERMRVPNVHVARSTAPNHDHVPIAHWLTRLQTLSF